MVRNRTGNTVAPLDFALHVLKGLWPDIQGLKTEPKIGLQVYFGDENGYYDAFSSPKRLTWVERARGRSTTIGFFPSCFKLRVGQALTKKAANYGKREDVG